MNIRKIQSRQEYNRQLVKEAAQALDLSTTEKELFELVDKAIDLAPSWFWNQPCFDEAPLEPIAVIVFRL